MDEDGNRGAGEPNPPMRLLEGQGSGAGAHGSLVLLLLPAWLLSRMDRNCRNPAANFAPSALLLS